MAESSFRSHRVVNGQGRPPAPGRAPFLVALPVLLACPAAPFAAAAAAPWGSPAPFVAALILHLAACALLAWVALRTSRAAGPAPRVLGYATAGTAVLIGLVTFLLMAYIGTAFGIGGRAWLRLRQGMATPGDAAYLGSLAAAGLTVLCALWLVAVLLRPAITPAGRTLAGSLRRRVAKIGIASVPAAQPAEPLYATGPQDGYLRRLFSPSARVLLLGCLVLAVVGTCVTALAEGMVTLVAAWAVLLAPVPAAVWPVLQSLWRPDAELGVVMAAFWRTMVTPFVAAPLVLLAAMAAALVPPVHQAFAAQSWPVHDWEGLLPSAGDTPFGWLGMGALIGFLLSLLACLAVTVAVVLPATAFFRPEQVIRENMLSSDPAHRAGNVAAVRALACLIPLLFIIPGVLVAADRGSIWWWTGIVLIPVAAALVFFVWYRQRVDHRRREEWGVQGAANPADPPPAQTPAIPPYDVAGSSLHDEKRHPRGPSK